jgi:SAM-dependent methyltransferase
LGQTKQQEWAWQWAQVPDVIDENLGALREWLWPHTPESFRGETVLECGCGSGHHARFMAGYAKRVVAVDLNATETAFLTTKSLPNVEVVEADIATMDFPEPFDAVYSLGVVHHTDDPDRTVANLTRLVRPGGRLLIRVYSREGNFVTRTFVEGARRTFLRRLSRRQLLGVSRLAGISMVALMQTVYRLPLRFLPYYNYFADSRRLTLKSNSLNIFDKLNAPQTHFITREQVNRWFNPEVFEDISIDLHHGTTWRASGRKKSARS